MDNVWHLYILECVDGSLYTGVTTDIARRLAEHNHSARGARYTRARRPVSLRHAWSLPNRQAATRAEAAFKRLRRSDKLAVIEGSAEPPWVVE